MNMININNVTYTKKDYLLMFLFMGISGNPVFPLIGKYEYLIFLIILFLLYGQKIGSNAYKHIKIWLAILSVIFAGQLFVFFHISWLGSLNYICKFVCGILVAYILQEKLPIVYLRLITFLAAISIVFYGIYMFTGQMFGFEVARQHSIIIFNQIPPSIYDIGIPRNAGMFWEAGAYAGYLMLTPILFVNNPTYLWQNHRKSCYILIGALLTTMSTTGYILLALYIMYFMYMKTNKKSSFLLSMVFVLPLLFYAFSNIDFLGEKITSQYEVSSELSTDDVEHGRFGSIVFDMPYIKSSPFFGNGFDESTRYRFHPWLQNSDEGGGFGNGFSGIIAYLGIPFMFLYLYVIYKNKYLASVEARVFTIVFVILLLQGECYMNYPLLLSLPFVFYYRKIN